MLQINVQKQLGNLDLQVNLTIPAQGVTTLFGLSGSGKTSLINLISGLLQPDQGYIRLNDRTLVDIAKHQFIPVHQRRIGYVFQDARLFPHYKVQGNLRYGCQNIKSEDFDYIVQLLGIEHLLERYPITLSGGEKQRVAIGRALLSNPDILLMDEPLSALDVPRKRELMEYLQRLSQQINIPILYVTHSLEELLHLADRVVLFEEGKVKAYDSVENLWQSPVFRPWQPENERSIVLCLPILLQHPVYQMTALALGNQRLWLKQVDKAVGDNLRICINSLDVSLSLNKPEHTSTHNILLGNIIEILTLSDRVDVRLQVEHCLIWATISKWALSELNLQVGLEVYIEVKNLSVV